MQLKFSLEKRLHNIVITINAYLTLWWALEIKNSLLSLEIKENKSFKF